MDSAPFLKWAGGKRWLAPKLRTVLSTPIRARFVEPFVGSGAAFFFLQPESALLADWNSDLMATYRAIRDDPDEVIRRLSKMSISKRAFDVMRRSRPRKDISRAVRLIYLNRTAFNGLYRVNQSGKFNVPYGCKPGTILCDANALRTASQLLSRAQILCQDFRQTLQSVNATHDIVYVDPPYTAKHDNNGFRRYNERIFTWTDQVDLARILVELAQAGARIIISNANHRALRNLYPHTLFHTVSVRRATCMAADPARRGICDEALIVSQNIIASRLRLVTALAGEQSRWVSS